MKTPQINVGRSIPLKWNPPRPTHFVRDGEINHV